MLVASGVAFGGASSAVLGQLPRVVGVVDTVIGRGTIVRARDIAVLAMAGDPVCQGDTIEVAAGGRVDIRLNDGAMLYLPAGTRLELGDFAQDSGSSSHRGLFAKTRSIFRLIGSRLAGSGILTADTPIGTVRASGFSLLSFAALTFSLLKDARAAEPNVTFLDDDTITYKDMHHGVFELVTKEANPRHIVVDDPGVTVILTTRGSSVGVSQVSNSPAHMEDLRNAQQEALAGYAKGVWAKGSGMPAYDGSPLLQPINFSDPDPSPIPNQLGPLPGTVLPYVIIYHPPPQPPKLNLGVAPTEVDTSVFDDFSTAHGTFSASTTNGGAITFGVVGGVASNMVRGAQTYDVSSVGTFGTFYLNSASGAYTFVPNNDAINALKVNAIQSFVITVSDGTLISSESFNITIVGVDDASIISGVINGSVVGAVGVNGASPSLLIANGLLTDTDVDDPANTFATVSTPTTSAGGYGSFTITTDGVWTYTLDNDNSTIQALGVGDVLTDSFTVTTIGGTPQVITITIHGPLIGAGTAPSLTLSETHLTATALDDNIAGSAPNAALTTVSADFSAAFVTASGLTGTTLSYALTITGGNGTASGLIDSHTGLADLLVLNGNTIEGRVGAIDGTLAFTIALDPITGRVTFTEFRAVTQPLGTSPDSGEGVTLATGVVTLIGIVTTNGEFQDVTLDLGSRLTITDDGPSIRTNPTAPSLTLSETHLTATVLDDGIAGSVPNASLTTTSADFSTAFSSVQGADGATIQYALAIAGGNGAASGLIDSHTGLADVLVLNGNTIEGRVGGTAGTLAFAITLDPATGRVTFTEYRPVKQPFGTDPDGGEAIGLSAGVVSLIATITDRDGDFQSASLDLGIRLSISDDGPTIATSGTTPSLTLSESHLTATALDDNIPGSAPDLSLTTISADFSTAFTSVQGADSAAIRYSLTIAGGNGAASGLIDSHTGLADVLVLNGNTIEGHVGTTTGTLAFSIALDPMTGRVTFTEYRAVKQSGTSSEGGVTLGAGIVSLVATITDKDGDFQIAHIDLGQQLTITGDNPSIATNGTTPSLTLSETHLTATAFDDNIAGSAPNAALTTTFADFSTAFSSVQGANGATIGYALTITGGNETASGLIDSHTGLADVLVLNGNTIEGHVGTTTGTLAFTITVNPATGRVTFTEYRAVVQPLASSLDTGEAAGFSFGIVNLVATITDNDGNAQSASLDLGKQLTITDDGPSIRTSGTTPALSLSETHLTATTFDDNIAGSAPNAAQTTTAADFSTAFTSVQGADGATIRYALKITGGNGTASGLIDSHTGLADVLVLNSNTIEGHVGATTGTLAFIITVDPVTGRVTFTEYRAVTQPLGTDPDHGEGVTLAGGIVSLTATITDKDGDFQSASLDLGKQLTITDDGPSITLSGTTPSLTLSETHLTATAFDDNTAGSAPNASLTTTSADFSTAFSAVQGADGASIGYALTITGGNGTASGLIDSHTGFADILVLNGDTIEGHVGSTTGTLAFTIEVDPATGSVTFTEYRPVTQPLGTAPDTGEAVALNAGTVNLVATVTDKDGDFQSASFDLGKQLTIADDGPSIGGFPDTDIAAQDNQTVNGTYSINFGADGDAGMSVAVHNGAVGATGYNLATSSLGGGITSVHVTGNGDDYSFYYTTHVVSGGVEMDAYLSDSGGTLADPYFKLLIDPDGTFSFNLESVDVLKQVTVAGSTFGASGGGTPSLTAPDGVLVITGSDNGGHPIDVKASSNGIAVGDTGLSMDPNEQLNLAFSNEEPQISFMLTQWQGNGTAGVVFKVLDGSSDVHDFSIDIPKPHSGNATVFVQETSDSSLINTSTFDVATSTYTLYVGKEFNKVQIDYDQAASGNATFAINNITYNEKTTIPSTDLLFDVLATDRDGDSAATNLQVDILGATTAAPAPIFAAMGSSIISDPVTHVQHDLIL